MRGAAAAWFLTLTSCHWVFGVDASGSDGGAGSDAGKIDAPAFCCVPRKCGAATTTDACVAFGCTWTATPTCAGDHAVCAANPNASTCDGHACTWDQPGPCGGFHSDCAAYSVFECSDHGCTLACRGTPTPCSSLMSAVDCITSGCMWDDTMLTCTGAPTPCENRFDALGCDAALGCTASCDGTPHLCEDHQDVLTCGYWGSANGGCTWDSADCGGTPHACASNGDPTACALHAGCAWSDTGGCIAPDDCAARPATACGNGCEAAPCP